MTIILRLQGLDVKAGTEDIRSFFRCVSIPAGGVYVLGGKLREAFIGFSSEEDARSALLLTGKPLRGSTVTLHSSSMEELEHRLQVFLKRRSHVSLRQSNTKRLKASPGVSPSNTRTHQAAGSPNTTVKLDQNSSDLQQTPDPDASNPQTTNSLDSNTAFLLGVYTVLQGLQSGLGENHETAPRVDVPAAPGVTGVSTVVRQPEPTVPGYVRLFGLPASATKETVCSFFTGLTVQEVIVNVKLGRGHACLVKFAHEQEAQEALHFNEHSLGGFSVEVRGATEKLWTSALQECENASTVKERRNPKQSPLRETAPANHRQTPTSPRTPNKQPVKRLSFKIPQQPNFDSGTTTSPALEYVVRVTNLPTTMTKTEIKELFGCPNISHKCVQHLLDKNGSRTDTAFLVFNRPEDYDYAMNLTGCHVGTDAIEVSSITRKIMRQIMAQSSSKRLKYLNMSKKKKLFNGDFDPVETSDDTSCTNQDGAAQTCLFVRNMHAHVEKGHIQSFFSKYQVGKNNITLLLDRDGNGIGEGLIQFRSEKLAALAQSLHGHDFLGTQVLLTLITVKQMEEILARHV